MSTGRGRGLQRAGFIAVWILGGIAQQVTADARVGVVNAKALWRTWVSTYWPRIHPVVKAPLFAVGASARALYRAGRYGGRTISIGARHGIEEGAHRHREFLELREHPVGTSGHAHVSQRISGDRVVRADVYRMRGEQIHGAAIQEREERNLWARASTLAELGEVTARWAEGNIKFHPNGYDEGPDGETTGLIPALVALNRSGFVTSCSQPGVGPAWGFDNRVWWQRAAVDGYTDPDTADRLEKACEAAGLIFINNGRAGWRTHWRNAVDVTASPVNGIEIIEGSPRYVHTGFGTHMSRRAVKFDFDCYGADALLNAVQITIIDPQWGRNDLLWETVAGHAPPRTEERYSGTVSDPSGTVCREFNNVTFEELRSLYETADVNGYEVDITDWETVECADDSEPAKDNAGDAEETSLAALTSVPSSPTAGRGFHQEQPAAPVSPALDRTPGHAETCLCGSCEAIRAQAHQEPCCPCRRVHGEPS